MPEVFYGIVKVLECCLLRERVGSSNPAWDLSLALSFFQVLSSVSVYNNSKFLCRNVFDTFSEVVVSSKYRTAVRMSLRW